MKTRRRAVTAWLALTLSGCGQAKDDDSGSKGMFGLFKSRKENTGRTAVHPSVGATLVRERDFPAGAVPPQPSYGRCTEVVVSGAPPNAKFVAEAEPGRTNGGFRIDGLAGVPPLLLVNANPDAPRFEVWETGPGATPALVRQREVHLDAAQSQWSGFSVQQVLCLPQQKQLLAVHYVPREARYGLYLHDARSGRFERLAERIQRDTWRPLPPVFLDLLPVSADTALALFRSDAVRLASEVYVNTLDHLLLFSPRHASGLEVLTLAVGDGNVRRLAMQGSKLCIEAVDPRERAKPVTHFWSLDLARVLA